LLQFPWKHKIKNPTLYFTAFFQYLKIVGVSQLVVQVVILYGGRTRWIIAENESGIY